MTEYEEIERAIRKPWLALHMDGRNKYGTHLLLVPPSGLCLTYEEYENLLNSTCKEVERVYKEAEALGYTDGCAIIVRREIEYLGLSNIDESLTGLIFGDASTQIQALERLKNRFEYDKRNKIND